MCKRAVAAVPWQPRVICVNCCFLVVLSRLVLPTGPAKKHLLIRVDSSGQPHQHLLSPKGSSSGTSHITHRHSQQRDTLQAAAVSALQQQQQGAAGVAAAVASTAAPVGTATVASRAVAGPQLEFGEATELQLEELEALEAIFGSEYSLVSSCPPTCVVRLREPDDSAACAGGGAGGSELSEGQPPSALFSLRFKLPKVSVGRRGTRRLADVHAWVCSRKQKGGRHSIPPALS